VLQVRGHDQRRESQVQEPVVQRAMGEQLMGRGNGDAGNTKPCENCGVNRVPKSGRYCSDCRQAQEKILGDLGKDETKN
jgi:hypothetical protein